MSHILSGLPAELQFLYHLYDKKEITPTKLSKLCGRTSRQVQRVREMYEKLNLLNIRKNPNDKRSVLISLTEEAQLEIHNMFQSDYPQIFGRVVQDYVIPIIEEQVTKKFGEHSKEKQFHLTLDLSNK